PEAQLVVYLYALHLVSRSMVRASSIRTILAHSKLTQKVQAYLCDAIESLLDAGQGVLPDEPLEEDEDGLERFMWRIWDVGDGTGNEVCGEFPTVFVVQLLTRLGSIGITSPSLYSMVPTLAIPLSSSDPPHLRAHMENWDTFPQVRNVVSKASDRALCDPFK
ncbi:MAG: hypothetical protein TREMPRED_005728, partial [Tremellales sp. Tagirdzhanova-0007]